jgi:Domain of unknown function (DUF4249)
MKNKLFYSVFLFIAIAVFAISCTKEESPATEAEKVVVEGYLIRGQPVTIKISRMIPYEGTNTTKYIDTAHVTIKEGSNTYSLPNIGNGEYYLPASSLIIATGKTYSLEFMYNNKLVTATTTIPDRSENFTIGKTTMKVPSLSGGGMPDIPDPIDVKWKNYTGDYYLVAAINYESSPDPISSNGGNNRPTFRSEPLQTNIYELRFQSFSYLGNHHVVLFHITSEYAALYKNSGTTSINITNVNSNVTNGLGIFTGINTDTLNLYLYK